jgi:hypothetical protein
MIAIHKTLRIINTQYSNEPAYLFTDSLTVLYLLNTQIKQPTLHNSHPDQTTLASMVQLLQNRSQPITLYKVRAHVNIDGNEQANKSAKEGLDLAHKNATHPYEHAHATPYYYQKDEWSSTMDTPYKGPLDFYKKIIKYDRINNLETMAIQTPNNCKWIGNTNIDKELSNEFWNNPTITDKQKSCLIKFRTGTYMGQAIKSLVDKDSPPSPLLYVIHTNPIHDYMCYSHVGNNIYTHYTSKDTTKQHGKLENHKFHPKNPDATLS